MSRSRENITVIEVGHLSADFWRCARLREEVLRIPLGLQFDRAQLAAEGLPQRHLAAWINNQLAGCAVLTPVSHHEARVRSVAVAVEYQRRGAGTALMAAATELARKLEFRRLVLDARVTAQPFYEKLGYVVEGTAFTKIGLPHVFMCRTIGEGR
ncbi:MAG: GNAT family N-acetyltransferase [Verrucomicrobiales bacterium]